MDKKFKSDISEAIHDAAKDLHDIGLITTKTMREFDKSCLTTVEPLSPTEIASLRQKTGVSQAIFAHYLNVTTSVVSKWERGEKHPQGPSLKLLNLVKKKGLESIA